jgi:hypothetical protein
MICVITGFPMFGQPPSPGLAEIALELGKAHPSTKVLLLQWDQTPPDAQFDPPDEPVLFIGHSFGACSSVMLSRHLEARPSPVHLLLIDPVRHQRDDRLYPVPVKDDPLAQLGGVQFDSGPNWVSALAFLRTTWTWMFPFHSGLGKGAEDANIQVPGTDHNTIIRAPVVRSMITAKAASLFD